MAPLFYCLLLLVHHLCRVRCAAVQTTTITPTQFLRDPQFIVSTTGTFKLGFFSPQNSTNRYVGVWFNKIPVRTIVWVANRNIPIKDSSGILQISKDGNLVLINGQKLIIWSTNLPNITVTNSTAQLLDSGNFVLQQSNSSEKPITLWQSFDHPSNTLIAGMKPTIPNTSYKKNSLFRSWKTPSDPSEGSFSAGPYITNGVLQIFTWENDTNFWRSGPWDGNSFTGLQVANTLKDGFTLVENQDSGTVEMSFNPLDPALLFNYVIRSDGTLIEKFWDDTRKSWINGWVAPSSQCEFYGKCGPFGSCHHDSGTCRCLQGFKPKNDQEWQKGNASSGCVRRRELQCVTQRGKQDKFLTLNTMKVPDNLQQLSAFSQNSCKQQCVSNCSCLAYAYHPNIGCIIWTENLIDTQEYSAGGMDLYLRVAASELDGSKKHKSVAINTSVTIISAIIVVTIIYLLRRHLKKKGNRDESSTAYKFEVGELDLQEPPLYTYGILRDATNNFDEGNKLGKGGFGSVYKGILETGQEIAVKRLSALSGQGMEEFMTEVRVISKLQHRNLVRLLGCCIEGDEKMLIYEYLPNKSLDGFIFNRQNKAHLSWNIRFNIIEGICRGLLYLHRDSRLRIIHRDLKPSNILLDEDLNPKISDFGMARIFGGNQDQANTMRVVGTYGYMSPEYTMGHFSEKSDVYSFGIILLELISGRRNSTFNEFKEALTLTGYAWKLWNDGNIVEFIDPVISDPGFQKSILRCIQIGLLCVQELARDRPNTSVVVSMLDSETEELPNPTKPPFTEWEVSSSDQQSSSMYSSSTNVSVTIVGGR